MNRVPTHAALMIVAIGIVIACDDEKMKPESAIPTAPVAAMAPADTAPDAAKVSSLCRSALRERAELRTRTTAARESAEHRRQSIALAAIVEDSCR
jgi:hypothetical protein